MSDLKKMYRTMVEDPFPSQMTISFNDGNMLVYEKHRWNIDGEEKGLRYGENPGQPAALYRPVNGNLVFGGVEMIQPGTFLASDIELLQSGKHPGKTNITDIDNSLNILKFLTEAPTAVIVKHNNPSGVAKGKSISEAYQRAYNADPVAAFGGAIALNRPVDRECAERILESYSEVVAAPEFEAGVLELFQKKKNLRVFRIGKMDQLASYQDARFLDFKSLMDGGIVTQLNYVPQTRSEADFLPAETEYKGRKYAVKRKPSKNEVEDMLFGWFIESGVTSNSVIYVKDGVTIGIGTGEQDRVGVAEFARDKAYRKSADRICLEEHGCTMNMLQDLEAQQHIQKLVEKDHGGLIDSVMISDAFFPFRDGIDVGLKEGVKAVIQPGGSLRDYEVIDACNEFNAAMVFTGQRSFKH
jgi:phosphoribosylaminoimidazolecarboxamide formyltransferase/IMP cyclohydrolase